MNYAKDWSESDQAELMRASSQANDPYPILCPVCEGHPFPANYQYAKKRTCEFPLKWVQFNGVSNKVCANCDGKGTIVC